MTPVTEADREAYLALNMLAPELAEAVHAGEWDHLNGMQVLARHREAAEQRARLEGAEVMREAAARVIESGMHNEYGRPQPALTAAIRSLDPAAIIAQHVRAKAVQKTS